MKKTLIWLIVIMVIMTTVTIGVGCKTKTTETTAAAETTAAETTAAETTAAETTAAEEITINIYQSQSGDNKVIDLYAALEKSFEEKNPGIKINHIWEGYDIYINKLKLLGSSKTLYELNQGWGPSFGMTYGENGSILDWGPFLNADPAWKAAIKPLALRQQKTSAMDVAVLPVPGAEIALGLFANLNVLKKYNLEIPTTFSRFLEEIKILNDNGITPIAFGAKDVWSSWALNVFVRRFCQGDNRDDDFNLILSGKEKFNNPEFLKGMNLLKELADAKAFPKNTTTLGYGEAKQLFIDGKAAFLNAGTWEVPSMSELMGEGNYQFIPVPAFENALDKTASFEITYGDGFMLGGNTKGKTLEATLNFVKYLSTKEMAQKFLDTGYATALNFELDLTNVKEGSKQMWALPNAIAGQVEAYFPTSFVIPYYNEALAELASGIITPEDALKMMDKWYEQVYSVE